MIKHSSSLVNSEDIKKIYRLAVGNWRTILFFIVLSTVIGLFYIASIPNNSLAKTIISLKSSGNFIESDNGYSKDFSQDEVTGINSPKIIEKAIESLHLEVSYFNDKNGYELFDSIPFKIGLGMVDKELYEKNIHIRLIDKTHFELSYSLHEKNIRQIEYFDSIISTPHLKLEVLKQFNQVPFSEIKDYFYNIKIQNKETLIAKIQSNLKTTLLNDLTELQVEYKDFLPKRAIAFLDTLSNIYLKNNIKSQLEKNSKMAESIDKLLFKTEITLKDLQDSLLVNKKKSGFIDNLEEQKSTTDVTDLLLDKKKLEHRYTSLSELESFFLANPEQGVPPPYFDENIDPFVKNGFTELYKIQLNKKDNLLSYTDKASEIVFMDKNYETRKANLLKYIKNTLGVLENKIAEAQKKLALLEVKNQTKEYNNYQLYMADIERQLKVNETMYMSLLEKRNNIIISQAAMAPEYKIIESPHIIEGVDGSRKKILIANFIFAGLLAAIIFIFFKKMFYEKIESVEELKEKNLPISILGELSYLNFSKQSFQHIVDSHKHPMFSLLLRVIRTNVDFALSDKKSKIILITSHLPNEGKTFTAANLGAMLAVANRKVLLLDLDLHKPNLRSALGLTANENSSITELLKKEIEIKEALSKTYNPNMDAIVSDKAIKGGSELLLSDVTQKVIDYGKEHYDYVIIDTPPVGLIPDALTLMNYSDMNIFVVNSASPNLKAINQANDIVQKNNFKLFFILNKVNVKRLQYYSKYNEKYDNAYVA